VVDVDDDDEEAKFGGGIECTVEDVEKERTVEFEDESAYGRSMFDILVLLMSQKKATWFRPDLVPRQLRLKKHFSAIYLEAPVAEGRAKCHSYVAVNDWLNISITI